MKITTHLAKSIFAGTGAMLIAGNVMAEDMTLKFAGVHPVNHYGNTVMEQIKTEIEAADVGLTIQLFPAGQLGSGEELLDDALRGNIDLVHSYLYPNRASQIEVISLPYLAATNADIETVYLDQDSAFNQILNEAFTGLGLELFSTVPEGFIGVVANEEPEDYAAIGDKGINIRVWGSQLAKSTVETIGFRATTMNWGEVFAALQSGAVDGAICCTAQTAYTTFAQSDVGKYFIPYNAVVEVTAYYASGRTWKKLNDEQKAVITSAFKNAATDFAEHALSQEAEFAAKLTEAGYSVLELSDEQREAIAAAVREKVWPQAETLVGAENLQRLQ